MNREDLIALADKPVIDGDGRVRPPTERERVARIVLYAIKNPEGIETIDWEIADAVIALRAQASSASTTEANPMTESEGKLAELIAEAKTITTQDAWNMSISDAHRTLVRLAALGTPAQPASGGVDIIARLNAIAPAVENLACHQEQCDADGVMVKVSRQAVDEVVNTINQLAIDLSASSSPASEAGREPVAWLVTNLKTNAQFTRFSALDAKMDADSKGWFCVIEPLYRASPPHPANQTDR